MNARVELVGFLLAGIAPFLTSARAEVEPATRASDVAISGRGDSRLEPFDRLMRGFLAERKIPGAALAVARSGRVVYARGFGFADLAKGAPVEPDALFRVASISKPVTAVAVLRLAEMGKIRLDEPVLGQIADHPAPTDARWSRITPRLLLQHRGGFDRDVSFDPMFRAVPFARELGKEPPATPEVVIRAMLRRPLDFDPGARYAYSNFGYCLLGRVIERATGKPYGEAVADLLSRPLGISPAQMRLGRTLPAGRASGEVRYHDPARGPSVFPPDVGAEAPSPYGAWCLESMDAHGGWIASAPALLRFATALDATSKPRILAEASIADLLARPPGAAGSHPDGKSRDFYYGLGWNVRPVAGRGVNTWHTGSLPGTSTLLVRRHDGLSWAVLFNTRQTPSGKPPAAEIDPMLHEAANAVRDWPEGDIEFNTRRR